MGKPNTWSPGGGILDLGKGKGLEASRAADEIRESQFTHSPGRESVPQML